MINSARVSKLREKFLSLYGVPCDKIVCSPGRVNLIGEHIDYCGYSVCPIAIEQSILLAVKGNDSDKVVINNVDERYSAYTCNITEFLVDDNEPLWHKYVLCGIQGIKDLLTDTKSLHGLDMLISGNIPPNAGLSSSSALVCAAALASSHCYNVELSREHLADQCASAERYIGTQGGGMDQAACLLSTKGMAMKINFNPLTMERTVLPKGAVFVVANSLVSANKAATSHFNCRVMECKLAAKIIAMKHGLSHEDVINDASLTKLKNLQERLNMSLGEMINLVKKYLHPESYSQEEICALLQITPDILRQNVLTKNTVDIQEFQLFDRATHVFEEARRVGEFKRLCDDLAALPHAGDSMHQDTLVKLGQLMYDSHASTQHLYCCSHPKLDTLVELSKSMAYGARLTGAGWGGCIVALVPEDKSEEFKEMLCQKYFAQEELAKDKNKDSYIFITEPGNGATMIS